MREMCVARWAPMLGVALVFLSSPALAAAKASVSQQAEVEKLVVCYARGTDALGSATDAVIAADLDSTVNVSDPKFQEALGFYRKCFAREFSFTLAFDGVPVLTVPDPASRTPETDAALQWANFVNNAFRAPGYVNTQHHMGTIASEITGNAASVVSYLIATHSYGPTSTETGVNVVGGTYTDEVVKQRGAWLIRQRTLNITSSVNIPAP
jgi:hypothetical protein